jgi:hypothetical protein
MLYNQDEIKLVSALHTTLVFLKTLWYTPLITLVAPITLLTLHATLVFL